MRRSILVRYIRSIGLRMRRSILVRYIRKRLLSICLVLNSFLLLVPSYCRPIGEGAGATIRWDQKEETILAAFEGLRGAPGQEQHGRVLKGNYKREA